MDITAERPTWLILGDWVIDENWFLVRHYSDLSKHTGRDHFRRRESSESLAGAPPDKIIDLCGAGHLVRTFYEIFARQDLGDMPKILAMGEWSQADEDLLLHLVHSTRVEDCVAGKLGYTVTAGEFCENPPADISLKNLQPESPTLRTVRLYEFQDNEWSIASRVDWAPPREETAEPILPSLHATEIPEVVVVDDVERGAVSARVVEALLEIAPQARFYVRVKKPDQDWLKLVADRGVLELVVLGPEVSPGLSPYERWHHSGAVTKKFIDLIEDTHSLSSAKNVAILTDRREVLGRFSGASGATTIHGYSQVAPRAINQVGWADAIAMTLTHELSRAPVDQDLDPERVEEAITQADHCMGVSGVPNQIVAPVPDGVVEGWRSWDDQKRHWTEATSGLGLISSEDSLPSLEVWRGSPQLPGYVSLIPEKVQVLDQIAADLRQFRLGEPSRSLGLMVEADPGSGKTYLAQCLARHFDFQMVECDVAQMVNRDELFDYFDRIATMQAQSAVPILAFVDEVNATIGGQPVYGALLSPLESGSYTRRGLTNSLRPCVWIFTGTKVKKGDRTEKHSDLQSRLSARYRLDFKSLKRKAQRRDGKKKGKGKVTDAARLEQVYFGASMVKRRFPDVTHIEKCVLESFAKRRPAKAPFRSIRRSVATMRNVQHGQVLGRNFVPAIAADSASTELVELRFKPRPALRDSGRRTPPIGPDGASRSTTGEGATPSVDLRGDAVESID